MVVSAVMCVKNHALAVHVFNEVDDGNIGNRCMHGTITVIRYISFV